MSPARFRCATQLCFNSMKSVARYIDYIASFHGVSSFCSNEKCFFASASREYCIVSCVICEGKFSTPESCTTNVQLTPRLTLYNIQVFLFQSRNFWIRAQYTLILCAFVSSSWIGSISKILLHSIQQGLELLHRLPGGSVRIVHKPGNSELAKEVVDT